MRDYSYINGYIEKLHSDIYPQPADAGHTEWATESIAAFMKIANPIKNVLDLGCGEAFCQEVFEGYGIEYVGVCLGKDFEVCEASGKNVLREDFSFLPFTAGSYDLLYSRHSLEHSPMPLLTLMEWHRVSKRYVALVLPSPVHWKYGGKNHYFVLNLEQWKILFDVAGFGVVYEYSKRYKMSPNKEDPDVEIEYWCLLEKL
jgi:hypothetical protein